MLLPNIVGHPEYVSSLAIAVFDVTVCPNVVSESVFKVMISSIVRRLFLLVATGDVFIIFSIITYVFFSLILRSTCANVLRWDIASSM